MRGVRSVRSGSMRDSPTIMELPDALKRYLADSELVVTSWSNADGELALRLIKDIGPETGRLSFTGVAHVCLPPALTIESIEPHTIHTVPADFWNPSAPPKSELGEAETIFLIFGSFGGRFYVIAESIAYEILQ